MNVQRRLARAIGSAVVLMALAVWVQGAAWAQSKEISGAGATFPYPIYARWADAYNKSTGVRLNYQSIGSGGGIAQIKAKTVDFGASDAPLKPEELDAAGLVQWPMVVGGAVPVVNLPGIKPNQLKLTPALLADIYLGKITNWNDAALKTVNPGVALPDKQISVVRRSDGGPGFPLLDPRPNPDFCAPARTLRVRPGIHPSRPAGKPPAAAGLHCPAPA